MNKRVISAIFLALFASLLAITLVLAQNDGITGETVTGKITQASVSVSLELAGGMPLILNILKPINGTYLNNESVPVVLDALDADEVWYNLDNGANVSVNATSFHIISSEGLHNLNVFIRNSYGQDSKQVSFFVNATKMKIIYSEYQGTNKGNSTQFYDYTFEELQNFSNVTFEDIRNGKILFLERINVTADMDLNSKTVNFDQNVKISSNKVEIKSQTLPSLNKSAELKLYDLTFVRPRVLRDSTPCSDAICKNINYYGGVLKFDVTGFTIYSSEETYTTTTETTGGGGGGEEIIILPGENVTVIEKVEIPPSVPAGLCSEDWQCGPWSECKDGLQTRTCTDANGCGTYSNKKPESKFCIPFKQLTQLNWTIALSALAIAIVLTAFGILILFFMRRERRNTYRRLMKLLRRGIAFALKNDIRGASEIYNTAKSKLEKQKSYFSEEQFDRLYKKTIELYGLILGKIKQSDIKRSL